MALIPFMLTLTWAYSLCNCTLKPFLCNVNVSSTMIILMEVQGVGCDNHEMIRQAVYKPVIYIVVSVIICLNPLSTMGMHVHCACA